MQNFTRMPLWHTLSDQREALDLRVVEDLERGRINTPRARKVHHHIHFWVLLHCLLNRCIHRQQGLFRPPIKLLYVVPSKRIYHRRHAWRVSSTRIVKVEHALDCTGLESIYERPRQRVEWSECRPFFCLSGIKVHNLVIWLGTFSVRVDGSDSSVLGRTQRHSSCQRRRPRHASPDRVNT